MNYAEMYKKLINTARERPKPDVYTERHHVIPKSLGGSNSVDNLVYLTAEEHFLAHLFLYQIHGNGPMGIAFHLMCNMKNKNQNRYVPTPAQFSLAKTIASESHRCRIRKPFSEDHKRNISEGQKGKILSEDHKRKLSMSMKGRKKQPLSEETKKKISETKRLKRESKINSVLFSTLFYN